MKPNEVYVVYNDHSNTIISAHAAECFADSECARQEELKPHASLLVITLAEAEDRICEAEKNYWSSGSWMCN